VVGVLQSQDPQVIGPYRLVGQLGGGGMGRVFLGLSAGGRPVAVKVIRAGLAADPEFRALFAQEVAAARRVSGLFTALVLDADTECPQPWLATAYVPGPSLEEAVVQQGPLPVSSLLALAAALAEGLSAIHAAGVVHCDLKPSNVLLASDGPRMIDFGIARAAGLALSASTGAPFGSPEFASPEQSAGHEVGPPSDMFSLGAVLTFAATGRPPFGTGPPPEVIDRVMRDAPSIGEVPPEIRPLVERCLAKEPGLRPAAGELLAELGAMKPAQGWLSEAVIGAFAGQGPLDPGAAAAPSRPGKPPSADVLPPRPGESEPAATARTPRRGLRQPLAAWLGGGLVAASAVAGFALAGPGRPAPAVQSRPTLAAPVGVPSTAPASGTAGAGRRSRQASARHRSGSRPATGSSRGRTRPGRPAPAGTSPAAVPRTSPSPSAHAGSPLPPQQGPSPSPSSQPPPCLLQLICL
jgi:hypothetical protein